MKKRFWNWVLIVLSLCVLFLYIYRKEGTERISSVVASLSYQWLLVALFLRVAVLICESGILMLIRARYQENPTWGSSFASVTTGIMIGYITPLAAGNLPVQIAILSRSGMRGGDCASVIVSRSILYQFSYATILIFSIVYQNVLGLELNPLLWTIIYTGFFLTLLLAAGYAVIPHAYRPLGSLARAVIGFLGRLRIVRDPEDTSRKIIRELKKMAENSRITRLGFWLSVKVYVLGIVQILCYNTITVCVFLSFSLSGASWTDLVTLQGLTSLVQAVVPSPGGMGAAEAGFTFIMEPVMGETVSFAMLAWRLITYYFPIVLGIITLGTFRKRVKSVSSDGDI